MENTIVIGKPFIEKTSDNMSKLCAEIRFKDRAEKIYYEVSEEYEQYLCTEKADAFVVNLLLYAMEKGADIQSDQKISERLMYQLHEYLIPAISMHIGKYKSIKIKAETSNVILENANGVGGSLSGGVDSFYTLLKHLNRDEPHYNLTHLTFFNAGASGEYGGDKARRVYHERIQWIQDVAEELCLPLVCVDTNFNEFLLQNHEATHTFRTLACVLALQKLFSRYYFASSSSLEDFAFQEERTGSYDILSVQMLSTENTVFYTSGGEVSRMDKLRFISNYDITYSKLNVCVVCTKNDSICKKCQRTMIELYALNRLDLYKDVFDLDLFERRKKRSYFYSTYKNREHPDWSEAYQILKDRGEITVADEARMAALYILEKQVRDRLLDNEKFMSFYKKHFYK